MHPNTPTGEGVAQPSRADYSDGTLSVLDSEYFFPTRAPWYVIRISPRSSWN